MRRMLLSCLVALALVGVLASGASALRIYGGRPAVLGRAGGVYIGQVTPIVPAPGPYAPPGQFSFRVSANGRRVIDLLSIDMSGDSCGGGGTNAGPGGLYPMSAAISASGSFKAKQTIPKSSSWAGGTSSFSGKFKDGGRIAVGNFTFQVPGTADTAACAGHWHFKVRLAPPVPRGLNHPAAGAQLSGYTDHAEHLTMAVNSTASALSGSVSVLTICRAQNTNQVAGEPVNGPLAFSAPVNGAHFSASANGLEIQGTFAAPGLVSGRLRLTYTVPRTGSMSTSYLCDSGWERFVAAATFIPAGPAATRLLQGDLRLALTQLHALGSWLSRTERAVQRARRELLRSSGGAFGAPSRTAARLGSAERDLRRNQREDRQVTGVIDQSLRVLSGSPTLSQLRARQSVSAGALGRLTTDQLALQAHLARATSDGSAVNVLQSVNAFLNRQEEIMRVLGELRADIASVRAE